MGARDGSLRPGDGPDDRRGGPLVHRHHNLEDAALFPAVRRADPSLNPVVDRLEEDHKRVAELLDEVEERKLEAVLRAMPPLPTAPPGS